MGEPFGFAAPGKVSLRVSSLRAGEESEPSRRSAALGERPLAALKLGLLAAGAAAMLLAAGHRPPLLRSVASPAAGVELRYPAGWHADWSASCAVAAWEQPPGAVAKGCRVFLMRLSWPAFEDLHYLLLHRAPPAGWREQNSGILAAAAACFGAASLWECPPAEHVALGGRPAEMLLSRCGGDWTALVVAPGEDLVLAGFSAPTAKDLRRVWKAWLAMIADARLDGHPPPAARAVAAAPTP